MNTQNNRTIHGDAVITAGKTRYLARGLIASVLALAAASAPAGMSASERRQMHEHALATAAPEAGYRSTISLADSIVKLANEGVIDREKIETLYARRGAALAAEAKALVTEPASAPIFLTRENVRVYVTLLWPLGLANRMRSNNESPLNGTNLSRFASTGGWTLGKDENGGAYFNRYPIVALTAAQEALVTRIALNVFRPCCDNSTFFQDCNHGSALLGLLALGAAQGLDEKTLYREALAFNSYWFSHHYAHIALYFEAVKAAQWRNVDPREALSSVFSSASGWRSNVAAELARRGLVPEQGGANCDV